MKEYWKLKIGDEMFLTTVNDDGSTSTYLIFEGNSDLDPIYEAVAKGEAVIYEKAVTHE